MRPRQRSPPFPSRRNTWLPEGAGWAGARLMQMQAATAGPPKKEVSAGLWGVIKCPSSAAPPRLVDELHQAPSDLKSGSTGAPLGRAPRGEGRACRIELARSSLQGRACSGELAGPSSTCLRQSRAALWTGGLPSVGHPRRLHPSAAIWHLSGHNANEYNRKRATYHFSTAADSPASSCTATRFSFLLLELSSSYSSSFLRHNCLALRLWPMISSPGETPELS